MHKPVHCPSFQRAFSCSSWDPGSPPCPNLCLRFDRGAATRRRAQHRENEAARAKTGSGFIDELPAARSLAHDPSGRSPGFANASWMGHRDGSLQEGTSRLQIPDEERARTDTRHDRVIQITACSRGLLQGKGMRSSDRQRVAGPSTSLMRPKTSDILPAFIANLFLQTPPCAPVVAAPSSNLSLSSVSLALEALGPMRHTEQESTSLVQSSLRLLLVAARQQALLDPLRIRDASDFRAGRSRSQPHGTRSDQRHAMPQRSP